MTSTNASNASFSRTSASRMAGAGMVGRTHLARTADPIPTERLARSADLVVRMALALMPFSAIAWTFIAH